jgi:hypothetical protein
VIAAIASSDSAFAHAFVKLVLHVARMDGRHAANVEQLGEPPADMRCTAEHSVYDAASGPLGRVDLRFDGGDDFTLLVENKLHSPFGDGQLERYHQALACLPPEQTRRGLVAITSHVPAYGELAAGTDGWLGAVRWARLLDEGLSDLPVSDPDVKRQWRLLLDVLDDQGDLGMTAVDVDLIRAWARYEEGRQHLAALLEALRPGAVEVLRAGLRRRRYAKADAVDLLAGPHFFGQREAVTVKRETQRGVWTGLRVPAGINRPAIRLAFYGDGGTPSFAVEVAPWKAGARLAAGEARLKAAGRKLAAAGFEDGV